MMALLVVWAWSQFIHRGFEWITGIMLRKPVGLVIFVFMATLSVLWVIFLR